MTRTWSKQSRAVRNTLCWELQVLVDDLLTYMDVSLTTGHRTKQEQNDLYPTFTKVRWPHGKHNSYPSTAVDMQPYPYPRKENDLRAGLGYMAGLCTLIAEAHGFKIRWGGDWNRNGDVTDQEFNDLFHIEVYE